MWYDQTNGLPDEIRTTATLELGPSFDQQNVPMEDRGVILWKQTKGEPSDYQLGWLFATPQALANESLKPLFVLINGTKRPYNAKPAGYVGNPGGYRAKGYERTPLPNRLFAYILTPEVRTQVIEKTNDLVIRPIYKK